MLSCAQPALHCKRITSLRAISREAGARVSGDILVVAGVGDIACPSVLPWHPPARAASCPPSHTQSREPAAELCPSPIYTALHPLLQTALLPHLLPPAIYKGLILNSLVSKEGLPLTSRDYKDLSCSSPGAFL